MVMGMNIQSPIQELSTIRESIIDYIEYWNDLEGTSERVDDNIKHFKKLKNDYDRAIRCLNVELHNYD